MSETAKFRRMDEGKKKRKKTYRKEKQTKEAHLDVDLHLAEMLEEFW